MDKTELARVENRKVKLSAEIIEQLEAAGATKERIEIADDMKSAMDITIKKMIATETGFSIDYSTLFESGPFKGSPVSKLNAALEPLLNAGVMQLSEVKGGEEGGRPRKVLSLSPIFNSDDRLQQVWNALLSGLLDQQKTAFNLKEIEKLNEDVWIAKKFFSMIDRLTGAMLSFYPSEAVPSRLVRLLGTNAHEKVEALGSRRLVQCPCPCKRESAVDLDRSGITAAPKTVLEKQAQQRIAQSNRGRF